MCYFKEGWRMKSKLDQFIEKLKEKFKIYQVLSYDDFCDIVEEIKKELK